MSVDTVYRSSSNCGSHFEKVGSLQDYIDVNQWSSLRCRPNKRWQSHKTSVLLVLGLISVEHCWKTGLANLIPIQKQVACYTSLYICQKWNTWGFNRNRKVEATAVIDGCNVCSVEEGCAWHNPLQRLVWRMVHHGYYTNQTQPATLVLYVGLWPLSLTTILLLWHFCFYWPPSPSSSLNVCISACPICPLSSSAHSYYSPYPHISPLASSHQLQLYQICIGFRFPLFSFIKFFLCHT